MENNYIENKDRETYEATDTTNSVSENMTELYYTKLIDLRSKKGMEMVQVAILIAIAVAVGLIFKNEITDFVNSTFAGLSQF